MEYKRKGQEEIVGFVLIVVLIVIVGVIFLGISLRKEKPVLRESEIIYQFLESSMEQTTDCKTTEKATFIGLDSLIRDCHETNTECTNGKRACELSQEIFREILNNTWQVGEDYPYKGYLLEAVYFVNNTNQNQVTPVINLSQGNCQDSYVGNSYWLASFPGSIVIRLKLCS
jgi:hypothetical protein